MDATRLPTPRPIRFWTDPSGAAHLFGLGFDTPLGVPSSEGTDGGARPRFLGVGSIHVNIVMLCDSDSYE